MMIGIGLSLGLGAMRTGGAFSSSHPLLLTRATEAWAQDLSGNLFAFGVNQRRLTNAGLTLTEAATRLHGEAPVNGSNFGATSLVLPVEGLFNPVRSISAGQAWHARRAPIFSTTSGTPVYFRCRVRSGRVRIVARDDASAAESRMSGPIGSITTAEQTFGAMTAIVNRLLPNGDREITFTWTPNATSSSATVSIGPDSFTSGETIDIIGMQATSQFSEWIMGGAGTVAQAADVASLDLTGVSMAAGFMLRMDGTLLATPRVFFDRFYQAVNVNEADNHQANINVGLGTVQFSSTAASVSQGFVDGPVMLPGPFSLVGAHGAGYIGGALNGVAVTPDTTSTYVTPNIMQIGARTINVQNLPITLTRITLFPETPTTPRVTEIAA